MQREFTNLQGKGHGGNSSARFLSRIQKDQFAVIFNKRTPGPPRVFDGWRECSIRNMQNASARDTLSHLLSYRSSSSLEKAHKRLQKKSTFESSNKASNSADKMLFSHGNIKIGGNLRQRASTKSSNIRGEPIKSRFQVKSGYLPLDKISQINSGSNSQSPQHKTNKIRTLEEGTTWEPLFSESDTPHQDAENSELLAMRALISAETAELALLRSITNNQSEYLNHDDDDSQRPILSAIVSASIRSQLFRDSLYTECRSLGELLVYLHAKQSLIEKQEYLIELLTNENKEYDRLAKLHMDSLIDQTKKRLEELSLKWTDDKQGARPFKRKLSKPLFEVKSKPVVKDPIVDEMEKLPRQERIKQLRKSYVVRVKEVNTDSDLNQDTSAIKKNTDNMSVGGEENDYSVHSGRTIPSVSIGINGGNKPSEYAGNMYNFESHSMISGQVLLHPNMTNSYYSSKHRAVKPPITVNMDIDIPDLHIGAPDPEDLEATDMRLPDIPQNTDRGSSESKFIFEIKPEDIEQINAKLQVCKIPNIQINPKKPQVNNMKLKAPSKNLGEVFSRGKEEELESSNSDQSAKISKLRVQKSPRESNDGMHGGVNNLKESFKDIYLRKPKQKGKTLNYSRKSQEDDSVSKNQFSTQIRMPEEINSIDTPSFDNGQKKKTRIREIRKDSDLLKKTLRSSEKDSRSENKDENEYVRNQNKNSASDQSITKTDQPLKLNNPDIKDRLQSPTKSNNFTLRGSNHGSQAKVQDSEMGESDNSSKLHPTLAESNSQNSSEDRHRAWQARSGISNIKPKSLFNRRIKKQ